MNWRWSVYAGGTSAAEGKHGYDVRTSLGSYVVQPFTTKYGRHAGYVVRFQNDKGKLPGGLHQELGTARSPNEGKAMAMRHFEEWSAGRNPALGKVKSSVVSPNTTEVEHGEATVLYSYETPVAVFVPGAGVYVTDKFWSRTTSTHIGKWIHQRLGAGVTRTKVSQQEIEELAREGGPRRNPTLAILGNPGENGYIAFYRGKQIEVYAPTSYAAQQKAAAIFKARKSYEVTVMLAEKGGEQVTHIADNPSRKKIARKVLAIDYVHASDGKKYTHDFTEDSDHGAVCAYVEDGGRRVVLEASDGKPIVGDY